MLSRKQALGAALAVAVVAALAFAALGQGKPSGKSPALFIDKRTVDLGEFIEGEDFDYTFVIKNKGEGELKILSARPG